MPYSDKVFYIRSEGRYLGRRDEWTTDKLYAVGMKSLADVRHNILRLRDYVPAIYSDVRGASDADSGRYYPMEELFR